MVYAWCSSSKSRLFFYDNFPFLYVLFYNSHKCFFRVHYTDPSIIVACISVPPFLYGGDVIEFNLFGIYSPFKSFYTVLSTFLIILFPPTSKLPHGLLLVQLPYCSFLMIGNFSHPLLFSIYFLMPSSWFMCQEIRAIDHPAGRGVKYGQRTDLDRNYRWKSVANQILQKDVVKIEDQIKTANLSILYDNAVNLFYITYVYINLFYVQRKIYTHEAVYSFLLVFDWLIRLLIASRFGLVEENALDLSSSFLK